MSIAIRVLNCLLVVAFAVGTLGVLSVDRVHAVDLANYAMSDIEVVYLYDDPQMIDWGTIYYLNDQKAARVNLVTIRPGSSFRMSETGFDERQLVAITAYGNPDSSSFVELLTKALFRERRPDLIIVGQMSRSADYQPIIDHWSGLGPESGGLFDIFRIVRWQSSSSEASATGSISINSGELAARYHDRMMLERNGLIGGAPSPDYDPPRFTRYQVLTDKGGRSGGTALLAGIGQYRLISLLGEKLDEGSVEDAVMRYARNYLSFFSQAQNSRGTRRVENLVLGYKSLIELGNQCRNLAAFKSLPAFGRYLQNELMKARKAVLDEIRVDWAGDIIRRDSPHGPKLKFRASLAVNGPQEVELSYIRFHPYWDSSVVVLDDESRKVLPHQAFVREYQVEIDRDKLESKLPDSLLFTAEIVYRQLSLPLRSSVPVKDIPSLSVSFEPDFHFIPPVARVDIDRTVSAMNVKAVITKPSGFAGSVTLNLKTPRGLFAGAYKTVWELSEGRTSETVRIPFSVSNLFEQGIQEQTIELSSEGMIVGSDTGLVRIASCDVSDKVNVGLFPDSVGLVEDILRMTGVRYQPITERALVTADLNAYQVLLIGSGALAKYPSIGVAKDRLEDYLRYGGSLVIMGQPSDWPEGLLPVSFIPTSERVGQGQISVRLPEGRIVSEGYDIDLESVLAWFDPERLVSPAVMAPSERVVVTQSGAGLLSISRIGEGQIIYCGLPLTEMIARLDLQAIHLLANLLNY